MMLASLAFTAGILGQSPAAQQPPQSAVVLPVTVAVTVLGEDGKSIPDLRQQDFRVLQDEVPQTIAGFDQGHTPITAAVLLEFASSDLSSGVANDFAVASDGFAQTLAKDDKLALITYDNRTHVVQDFTKDKGAFHSSIAALKSGTAMSAETNLFDALCDTLDRLETMDGRKYLVLVSSGRDTSSRKSLDEVLKKVQGSDVVIYSVNVVPALRTHLESHGQSRALCPVTDFSCSTTLAVAENLMRSLASMSGGKLYAPPSEASMGDAFANIGQTVRHCYSISYHPSNSAQDGLFRKIRVKLVDETGNPLRLKDSGGKDVKYRIVCRDGYKAKQRLR